MCVDHLWGSRARGNSGPTRPTDGRCCKGGASSGSPVTCRHSTVSLQKSGNGAGEEEPEWSQAETTAHALSPCIHTSAGWGDGRSTMHTLFPHTTPAPNTSTHNHQNPAAPAQTQHTTPLRPSQDAPAVPGLHHHPAAAHALGHIHNHPAQPTATDGLGTGPQLAVAARPSSTRKPLHPSPTHRQPARLPRCDPRQM